MTKKMTKEEYKELKELGTLFQGNGLCYHMLGDGLYRIVILKGKDSVEVGTNLTLFQVLDIYRKIGDLANWIADLTREGQNNDIIK